MATPTAVDVVMPQMGVSVSEGTITKWLKQEGEEIQADEPLLEISTDKVDTEVPSPGTGVVQQILVQEGETVDVGTRLAVIGARVRLRPSRATARRPRPRRPRPSPRPPSRRERGCSECRDSHPAGARGGARRTAHPGTRTRRAWRQRRRQELRLPVVARIASEHRVDVSQVPGTGRGGRVTKKDILGFVESGGQAAQPAAEPRPRRRPRPRLRPRRRHRLHPPRRPRAGPTAGSSRSRAACSAATGTRTGTAAPSGELETGEQREPMTAMRKGIAEHMRRSLDTSAHVTSAIEVDLSRVVDIRTSSSPSPEELAST